MSGINSAPALASPFARAKANACPPPGTEMVAPVAFSHDWTDRPTDPVLFGIRPLSNADVDFVRGEALKKMGASFPGIDVSRDSTTLQIATETYNDLLMQLTVARGTCDPNDARRPHPVWQGMADDIVHEALTAEGTKAIYDAIERVTLASSPTRREIQDDELQELMTAPKAFAAMPDWHARRVRRLLAWCLEQCKDATAPDDEMTIESIA